MSYPLGRKYAVLEEYGEEFDTPTERIPNAEDAAFNPAGTGLASTNVQAAIAEVAAASGGHYSWRKVVAGAVVSIPFEQQMVSYQEIEIADTGELIIEGEVVIIV